MSVKDTVIISLMAIALIGYLVRATLNYLNRVENDINEGVALFFALLILTCIFL